MIPHRAIFIVAFLAAITQVSGFAPIAVTITRQQHIRTFSLNALNTEDASAPEQETSAATTTTCWNPQLRRVMGAIATLGSLETAYLTASKLSGTTEQICDAVGGSGGCSSVLTGPYSFVPGTQIPLSIVGFVLYTTAAILALAPTFSGNAKAVDNDATNRILLTAITTTMGVFSVFLMTLLFFVLKETCPFCIASAIFSISLAGIAWLGGCLPQGRIQQGATVSLGGAAAALIAAVILFASSEPPFLASASSGAGSSASSSTLLTKNPAATTNFGAGEMPPAITTESSPRAIALAKAMVKLNAQFYGAFWCSHCWDQKQTMGKEAMSRIPYIECSRDGFNSQADLCRDKKVPGYPTWEIAGRMYPGDRTLDELEEIVKNVASSSSSNP